MLPILKALKDRLLNEPAFFIASVSALAAWASTEVSLPGFVVPLVVVIGGIATRSLVTPVNPK